MTSKIAPEKLVNGEINPLEDILTQKFNKSALDVKEKLFATDEDKLFLYANYKQALFGDNTTPKPSIFDRVAMAKWKSWSAVSGKSKEQAMTDYIKKVGLMR